MGFLRYNRVIMPSITAQAGVFALTGQSASLTYASAITAGTNTPVMALTSVVSDASPKFLIYGEWQAGDDLQFERQVFGGDWSAATITNHTVTSGEISGTAINLALAPLTAGNYQYRCKYKHSAGTYSLYSPYESGAIDFTPKITFLSAITWTGSGGSVTRTAATVPIGSPYANRRLYLFGIFCDSGSGNTVASVKFNGSTSGVTLVQAGAGEALRWSATVLMPSGSSVDVEINFASGVFNPGSTSLYGIDNSLMSSPTPVSTQFLHVSPGGTAGGTLNLPTSAGGVAVTYGTLFGGTNTSMSVTSSSDNFVPDASGFIYDSYHANGTLARTATITWGWANNSSDGYLTAWSLR
jgi:hypothetical protein